MEALVRHHAVAVVLAIIGATSCGANTPGGYLPLADLRAEPAAAIAPPGSVELRTVAAEPFNNITGPEAGFYGHLFGTTLAAADVAAFYARELPRVGWTKDRPPIGGSVELKTWGWCKPKMFFRLAILDTRGYDRAGLTVPSEVTLVFDARVTGAKGPCPS